MSNVKYPDKNGICQLRTKFEIMLTNEVLGVPQDWDKEFEFLGGDMPGLFYPYLLAKDVVRFGEMKAFARADSIARGIVLLLLEKLGWKGLNQNDCSNVKRLNTLYLGEPRD